MSRRSDPVIRACTHIKVHFQCKLSANTNSTSYFHLHLKCTQGKNLCTRVWMQMSVLTTVFKFCHDGESNDCNNNNNNNNNNINNTTSTTNKNTSQHKYMMTTNYNTRTATINCTTTMMIIAKAILKMAKARGQDW